MNDYPESYYVLRWILQFLGIVSLAVATVGTIIAATWRVMRWLQR